MGAAFIQLAHNCFDDRIETFPNFVVPKAQNNVALGQDFPISPSIACDVLAKAVLAPIKLYGYSAAVLRKIGKYPRIGT